MMNFTESKPIIFSLRHKTTEVAFLNILKYFYVQIQFIIKFYIFILRWRYLLSTQFSISIYIKTIKNHFKKYSLNSSRINIPPFCVKHFRI